MKQYLSQQYKNTISKYKKFKARFEKTVQNGVSNKKRRDLFQRLRRLYSQITRLETQVKLAVSAGALSLALVAAPTSDVLGQNVTGGKYKYIKRNLELPKGDYDQGALTGYQVYPAFADLDNDGDNDLVLGLYGGGAVFYQRNTNPDTGLPEYTLIPNDNDASPFKDSGVENYGYFSPTFADLDNDGDLDMVAGYADGYGYVTLFKNVDGKFVHFEGYANPFLNVYTYSYLAVGGPKPQFLDVDQDGDLDLFVSGNEADKYTIVVKYYENEGENTGVYVERTGADNPLGFVNIGVTPGAYYNGYGNISLADVDNDGDMDAYIGEKYGSVYEFKNNGDNTFAAGTVHPTLSFPTNYITPQLAFQDMDDDGDLDCLMGDKYSGTLPYHKNDGAGAFTRIMDVNTVTDFDINHPGSLTEDYLASAAIADIDKDGDTDFLSINIYGDIRYFSGNGDGTFEELTGASNPFGAITGGNFTRGDLVDFDNDGDVDLFLGDQAGTFRYFRNDAGVFTEQVGATNPLNGVDVGAFATPQLIDFDKDGDLDLVSGEYGGVKLYLNTAGVFTDQLGTNNPFDGVDDINNIAYAPKVIDVDGDGDLDLVLGAYPATGLRYFVNDGNNVFTEETTSNPFSAVSVYAMANPSFGDLDNDGDMDLLAGEFDYSDYIAELRYFERAGNNFCAKIDEIRHKIAVNEVYTFVSDEFKDVYNDEPDTKYKDFPKIKILTTPQFGTLKVGGAAVNPGSEILYADLGELVYTPNQDYTGLDAFTWAAYDAVGNCYSTASYGRFGVGVDVTGIDDELNKYVKVYPNPTQGTFNIAFDKVLAGNVEMKLYNAVGALIKTYTYENPSDIQAINLENMPKGLYVLRVSNQGKVGNIKVIKD